MTIKNVQAYIPYSRGVYGNSSSNDAEWSSEYRKRMKLAAQRMKRGKSTEINIEKIPEIKADFTNFNIPVECEENKSCVLRLRLELVDSDSKQPELDSDALKLAKAESSLSRIVLVPGNMTLHSMHYMIQKLFGWQNSHLHNFRLPEELENELTAGNKLAEWSRLCGVYFCFPGEYDDIFWDDDYFERESSKTWMRRKYNGPYYDGAKSERYANCQKEVRELRRHFSEFEVREDFGEMYDRHRKTGEKDGPRSKGKKKFDDATIRELETAVSFDHSFYELLEHIELYQILMPGISTESETVASLRSLAIRLAEPLPIADRLEYEYDYGDDWKVSIECLNEYFMKESSDGTASHYFDKDGIQVLDDEIFTKVGKKLKPVCIESDGLPVMDDAGGIHGFIETLRTIKEPVDPEDAEALQEQKETKSWARMQGWTGKKVKPENLL